MLDETNPIEANRSHRKTALAARKWGNVPECSITPLTKRTHRARPVGGFVRSHVARIYFAIQEGARTDARFPSRQSVPAAGRSAAGDSEARGGPARREKIPEPD